MTFITHIQVGDKRHVPTRAQLDEILEEFEKPLPVFTSPVKITNLGSIMPIRFGIMITDPNWSPTPTEIAELRAQFEFALADRNGATVVTRFGVTLIELPTLLAETP